MDAILEIRGGSKRSETHSETQYKTLDKFSRNLTQAAREGKLDPIYGREEEISRLIQILCRRTKNNPVLMSERPPSWKAWRRKSWPAMFRIRWRTNAS